MGTAATLHPDRTAAEVADLTLARPATLPAGESKFGVEFLEKAARSDLTVWIAGKSEEAKP